MLWLQILARESVTSSFRTTSDTKILYSQCVSWRPCTLELRHGNWWCKSIRPSSTKTTSSSKSDSSPYERSVNSLVRTKWAKWLLRRPPPSSLSKMSLHLPWHRYGMLFATANRCKTRWSRRTSLRNSKAYCIRLGRANRPLWSTMSMTLLTRKSRWTNSASLKR